MYIAYLAGPITGLSFDDCTDWREKIISLLPKEVVGMSPLRGKHYLADCKVIEAAYENIALSSSRGITTRDYNDCKRCDILIVNLLGATKVSIGTVMEIAWARSFQTPVILIMEKEGNVHDHPMINECVGFRVTTLEEAARIATCVLCPVPHRSKDE